MSNILVIPDLQIPFQHKYALTFLKRIRDEYQPDVTVCVGDETDQAALSRYPKDPNGQSAGDELKRARRTLKDYYAEFPEVLVCNSNHMQRLYKGPLKRESPGNTSQIFMNIYVPPKNGNGEITGSLTVSNSSMATALAELELGLSLLTRTTGLQFSAITTPPQG